MKALVLIILVILSVSGCAEKNEKITTPYEEQEEVIHMTEISSEETAQDESKQQQDPTEETSKKNSDYVLPESDTKYYMLKEIAKLSPEELRIARNEIYARHGREFDSQDLKNHFQSKEWYDPTVPADEFDENVLNEYEKANIDTILQAEAAIDEALHATGTYRFEKIYYTTGEWVYETSNDTIEITYADSEKVLGIYHREDEERNCDWAEYDGQEVEFSVEDSLGFGGNYGNQDMADHTSIYFDGEYLVYFEDGADCSWWYKKIN